MQGKESGEKSLPELEEADLNWMYDTMMRTMFYKAVISAMENRCIVCMDNAEKSKQGLKRLEKLQWNVINVSIDKNRLCL